MQGGWHAFDYWRKRNRDLLKDAEAQRLARTRRPDSTERLGDYRRLLSSMLLPRPKGRGCLSGTQTLRSCAGA